MNGKNLMDILRQGSSVWNDWIQKKPDGLTKLHDVGLSGGDFRGIDLSGAILRGAIICDADFSEANLSGAILYNSKLVRTKFNRANLKTTHLTGALLWAAELSEANLRGSILYGSNLHKANLYKANLSRADIRLADLTKAHLLETNLSKADLSESILDDAIIVNSNLMRAKLCRSSCCRTLFDGVNFSYVDFQETNLSEAEISCCIVFDTTIGEANLNKVIIRRTILKDANLREARLNGATIDKSDLSNADLRGAGLIGAKIIESNLSNVKLNEANLIRSVLLNSNFTSANLSGCKIFGISAWKLNLDGAVQSDLEISDHNEPIITVDNMEVAQFIYLLINNKKIRDVIDTISKKLVLILGRFKPERKIVLDAIRDELRKHDYLPIIFDFDRPENRSFIETIGTLAHLSRFVIADVTDPKIVLHEIPSIVEKIAVPVIPLLLAGSDDEPVTLIDLRVNHRSLLDTYVYTDIDCLLASFKENVIRPAETKATELIRLRAS